jgi:NAD+ synthase
MPSRIIDKPPSAGLWADQTDEGEMGLTYDELDAYLLTGTAPHAVKAKVDALHATSEHKRTVPRVAPKPGA